MSRRNRAKKREVIPDPIHGSTLVTAMVSRLIVGGKKSIAEKILYGSISTLAEKTGKDGLEVFNQALQNVKPVMEVKSRRVGGSNYQVPIEVRPERAIALSLRWIVANSRHKKGKSMTEKLTEELLDAYNNTGASIKKKEDTHKMAEANKAFAHFRW